jgi:hypothetical protein
MKRAWERCEPRLTLHKNDDAHKANNEGWMGIINKTLAYPMSQSTVSLRYSGSFSSLKSGEENNTENDEVGKEEEGRRPPKVAFFTSTATSQPAVYCTVVENFLDWLENETVQTRCQIDRFSATCCSSSCNFWLHTVYVSTLFLG